MLLCAPALRALRRRFPETQIHFLVATEFREAAELLPEVDQIIELNRKTGWRGLLRLRRLLSRRYDLVVDLQNSWRSSFLRTLCFPLMWTKAVRYRFRRWLLIQFKWNTYGKTPPVPLRYLAATESFGGTDDGIGLDLAAATSNALPDNAKLVVLCPGAKHFTKRWPVENWKELAQSLKKRGYSLIVCGSKTEEADCTRIAAGERVLIDSPLGELGNIMRQAQAVICQDSGLMHLAVGNNTPVVAIFGPTVEEFGFFPFRARARVLQNELSCRPCTAFGGSKCPKVHHNCMKLTTPDRVMEAFESLVADVAVDE